MTAPILALIAAVVGGLVALLRRLRRSRLPGHTMIISPRKATVIAGDGAVRSVQMAELTMAPEELERLWNPTNLERLGRTYWLWLSRATLGFCRVVYGEHERSVVFLGRPFTLLRFDAPDYVTEPDHGTVSWKIRDGLLVARGGRGCGFLALDVRLLEPAPDGQARIRIEVEVANFYPSIAASFSTPVYIATQSFIHVLVTHGFLRSLATLELAESKVGRFRLPRAQAADDQGNGAATQPAATASKPDQP